MNNITPYKLFENNSNRSDFETSASKYGLTILKYSDGYAELKKGKYGKTYKIEWRWMDTDDNVMCVARIINVLPEWGNEPDKQLSEEWASQESDNIFSTLGFKVGVNMDNEDEIVFPNDYVDELKEYSNKHGFEFELRRYKDEDDLINNILIWIVGKPDDNNTREKSLINILLTYGDRKDSHIYAEFYSPSGSITEDGVFIVLDSSLVIEYINSKFIEFSKLCMLAEK